MKMRAGLSMVFLAASIVMVQSFAQTAQAADRTPFTDVLFDSAPSVKVEVNGDEFYLLAINGTKREEIMKRCEASYAEKCSCQLSERFTETMAQIGLPVGDTVALRLYKFWTHSTSEIADQPVSSDNQDELLIKREQRNEVCFP